MRGCGTTAGPGQTVSVLEGMPCPGVPVGRRQPVAEMLSWDQAACHPLAAAKSRERSWPPLTLKGIIGRQQDPDLGNFTGKLRAFGGRELGSRQMEEWFLQQICLSFPSQFPEGTAAEGHRGGGDSDERGGEPEAGPAPGPGAVQRGSRRGPHQVSAP